MQASPSFLRRAAALAAALAVAGTLPLAGAETHAWTVDDLKTTPKSRPDFDPGRRPDQLFSRAYLRLLADDTRDVLTAPLHWDKQDWLIAGGLGGLVAGAAFFDGNIRTESQENRTKELDTFTRNAQRFGAEYSWAVIGGFEAFGLLADNAKARAVALDGATASIIASGIVTPALKYSIGRVRPNASARTFELKPFSGNYSFPSGHTTQAFALASVIAAHYDNWWVQGAAYGLAGVVGYSRIEQNSHYASDVVAGAIIGTAVGRFIVHRHNEHPNKPDRLTIAPYFGSGGSGLMFSRDF